MYYSDIHAVWRKDISMTLMLAKIKELSPDLLILGGDIADFNRGFETVLDEIRTTCADIRDIAVIAGNHELWYQYWSVHLLGNPGKEEISDRAFNELPSICARVGCRYLEEENIELGNWTIAGSVAWYDYSYKNPVFSYPDEFYASTARKSKVNNDGKFVKSLKGDKKLAEECSNKLLNRLKNISGQHLLVATHMPVFDAAVHVRGVNTVEGVNWELGAPYFYNLTLGRELLKNPKLRAVVSGHTHRGVDTWVQGPFDLIKCLVSYGGINNPICFLLRLCEDGRIYNKKIGLA